MLSKRPLNPTKALRTAIVVTELHRDLVREIRSGGTGHNVSFEDAAKTVAECCGPIAPVLEIRRRKAMRSAAWYLEVYAKALKEGASIPGGAWGENTLKHQREFSKMTKLAKRLRALAK